MKKRILYAMAFVLCLSLQQVAAQRHKKHKERALDFLVTNSRDTIYGKYKKTFLKPAYFLANGEKLPLDPQLYSAYSIRNSLFRSVKVSSVADPQWMRCLEDGEIKLYQYVLLNTRHSGPPSNSVIWLAQKNGGPYLNVNGVMSSTAVAQKNLYTLILDKPSVVAAYKTTPYNWRAVQMLIHQYNTTAQEKDAEAEK